jgi:hypothetical protein
VARDATARLYDVDADSMTLDKKAGTITFRARKGRLVDLDRLHESVWATRLGDRTGMRLLWLEVTAAGEVVVSGDEVKLKVAGSDHYFLLGGDPKARPGEKSALARLRESARPGERVTVTGRVEGWEGNFTQFLGKLPGKPRRLLVKEFQAGK